MSASWLAQMGWEVAVLDPLAAPTGIDTGPDAPPRPLPSVVRSITPATLADWLASPSAGVQVIDVTTSANHVKRHIPGAWFALRPQLAQALKAIPPARRYVLTCGSNVLAPYAAKDLQQLLGIDADAGTDAGAANSKHGGVFVLEGGTAAWIAAGLPVESGEARLASPRIDRYRRPYEGTDNPHSAMQAYLDWEFGLVAQLERDGTHHFAPI
jgi:rhodanese-related sulfurtransferase